MADKQTIPVALNDTSGQSIRLADFAATCNALKLCLFHVARSIADVKVEYEITRLQEGSALMDVAPSLNGVMSSVLSDIRKTFLGTVRSIEKGRPVDSRLDFTAIRSFQGFFSPVLRPSLEVEIGSTRLTSHYVDNLREMLKPSAPALGSVSGMLEALTVHNTTKFTLFPPMHGEQIECEFNPELLEDVLEAVGRKVTVYGTLYYSPSKVFPSAVEATHFDIEQDDSVLPTLLNAKGIMSVPQPQAEPWHNGW